MENDKVKVPLSSPIRAFGEELHFVEVPRRLRVGHLRKANIDDVEKVSMGQALRLVEALTELPESAVDELVPEDLPRIMGAVEGFTPPPTGKKPRSRS